ALPQETDIMLSPLAVVLMLGMPLPAFAANEDAVKADKAKLQGTWLADYAERRGGEKAPEAFVKSFKVVFSGDQVTFHMGPRRKEAKYTLDPGKNPKEIDMTSNNIPSPAIYSVEGDTLKLVIDEKDKTRAKEFKTEKGSFHMLFILKREKK